MTSTAAEEGPQVIRVVRRRRRRLSLSLPLFLSSHARSLGLCVLLLVFVCAFGVVSVIVGVGMSVWNVGLLDFLQVVSVSVLDLWEFGRDESAQFDFDVVHA